MSRTLQTHVLLLRGINVGGKNKLAMAELKRQLEAEGFANVVTQGHAGTVVLDATVPADAAAARVEALLPARFKLDTALIMVAAFESTAYRRVVQDAPPDFGADDAAWRYYVLFLKDVTAEDAMKEIEARPGIDSAWPGPGAIYYRLPSIASGLATKSRLNRVMQKPIYQQMTIRNWATTSKVIDLLDRSAGPA